MLETPALWTLDIAATLSLARLLAPDTASLLPLLQSPSWLPLVHIQTFLSPLSSSFKIHRTSSALIIFPPFYFLINVDNYQSSLHSSTWRRVRASEPRRPHHSFRNSNIPQHPPFLKETQASRTMIDLRNHGLILGLIVLVALATPAAAFGAGNIASTSKVEGQNCSCAPNRYSIISASTTS